MVIYGQYMAIYGHISPYVAIYWPYMAHMAIYGHILVIYGHIRNVRFSDYQSKSGGFLKPKGHLRSLDELILSKSLIGFYKDFSGFSVVA